MNRAQYIIEIFQSSDERPVPEYDTSFIGDDVSFSHTIMLSGTEYNLQLLYMSSLQVLGINFIRKSKHGEHSTQGFTSVPNRSKAEITQSTRDVIKIIRALVQILMDVSKDYNFHFIVFSADISDSSRVKLYDRMAKVLSQRFGELTIHRGDSHKVYRIRVAPFEL